MHAHYDIAMGRLALLRSSFPDSSRAALLHHHQYWLMPMLLRRSMLLRSTITDTSLRVKLPSCLPPPSKVFTFNTLWYCHVVKDRLLF